MNRVNISICLLLPFLLVCSTPDLYARSQKQRILHIQAPREGPAQRIYFHSPSGDAEALLKLRKHLIRQGAGKVNCFVPFVVVCDLPSGINYAEHLADTDITLLRETDIADGKIQDYAFGPAWAKQCYAFSKKMLANELRQDQEIQAFDRFVMPDMNLPNRPPGQVSASATLEVPDRLLHQNSEFMIGDILAQIVYPESQGPQENWTDSQLSQAASAAVLGMLYYQEIFSRAPIDFIFRSLPRAPTTTEPINYSHTECAAWITNVMNLMGYQGDQSEYLNLVHQFNNEWRIQWGTDWVFTAFIVNSTNDEDHRFGTRPVKEFYLGISHLGGPYMAIPFPAGYPGVTALRQVFTHELGHVFWALYEHLGNNDADCESRSGYLNYKNWNKTVSIGEMGGVEGCSPSYHPVSCIMNITNAYYGYNGPPCDYSIGMLGLADANNNRIPDAADAAPAVVFENADLETTLTSSIQLRFQAIAAAVPNRNPNQHPSQRIDYALPIKDVSYLVNGVGPIRLYPDDGVYNEDMENFAVDFSELIPGYTTVEVITRNTLGASSEGFIKKIYYLGLNFVHFAFDFRNDGIGISWEILGATFDAKLDLHRITRGPVYCDSVIAANVEPSRPPSGYFTPFSAFDGCVDPGCKYRYYVEGTFTIPYRGRDTTITHRSKEVEVTASLHIDKLNIISAPSPNPFRDQTWFSIRVPSSTLEAGTQGPKTSGGPENISGAARVQEDVPTHVNIKIYNALGQLIKKLHAGWSYATVLTITWDGTNDNNERVPSGVYFLRANAGPYTQVQKVLVLR